MIFGSDVIVVVGTCFNSLPAQSSRILFCRTKLHRQVATHVAFTDMVLLLSSLVVVVVVFEELFWLSHLLSVSLSLVLQLTDFRFSANLLVVVTFLTRRRSTVVDSNLDTSQDSEEKEVEEALQPLPIQSVAKGRRATPKTLMPLSLIRPHNTNKITNSK